MDELNFTASGIAATAANTQAQAVSEAVAAITPESAPTNPGQPVPVNPIGQRPAWHGLAALVVVGIGIWWLFYRKK